MKGASASRGAAWAGALELGDSWAIWRGAVGDGEAHRHFAAQAVIAPEPVSVIDGFGRSSSARCVLVEPFALHRLGRAEHATLIYVEPRSRIGPELSIQLRVVRDAGTPALVAGGTEPGFWSKWLNAAAEPPRLPDARIVAAKEYAELELVSGVVSLTAVARRAELSPDRFRHLFAEQVGLPFRRWLLWRRLRLAASEVLKGQDATTAAHAAGFADSAHFARTMKSMFGVTAGQTLLR